MASIFLKAGVVAPWPPEQEKEHLSMTSLNIVQAVQYAILQKAQHLQYLSWEKSSHPCQPPFFLN
jgi:hypothetical protein